MANAHTLLRVRCGKLLLLRQPRGDRNIYRKELRRNITTIWLTVHSLRDTQHHPPIDRRSSPGQSWPKDGSDYVHHNSVHRPRNIHAWRLPRILSFDAYRTRGIWDWMWVHVCRVIIHSLLLVYQLRASFGNVYDIMYTAMWLVFERSYRAISLLEQRKFWRCIQSWVPIVYRKFHTGFDTHLSWLQNWGLWQETSYHLCQGKKRKRQERKIE